MAKPGFLWLSANSMTQHAACNWNLQLTTCNLCNWFNKLIKCSLNFLFLVLTKFFFAFPYSLCLAQTFLGRMAVIRSPFWLVFNLSHYPFYCRRHLQRIILGSYSCFVCWIVGDFPYFFRFFLCIPPAAKAS